MTRHFSLLSNSIPFLAISKSSTYTDLTTKLLLDLLGINHTIAIRDNHTMKNKYTNQLKRLYGHNLPYMSANLMFMTLFHETSLNSPLRLVFVYPYDVTLGLN